jgi:hypothetical protein
MKYFVLMLLLLTGCTKVYTSEECADYVLRRAGVQEPREELKGMLILLCKLKDNKPTEVIKILNE